MVVQVAPPQKARNKARRKHRQRKLDNYSDVSSCDDYSSDDDDVSPYRSAKREQEPKNLGKPFSATPSATEAFDYENKWTNGICNCCSNVTGCCFAHLCTVCYACRLFDKAHVWNKSLISGAVWWNCLKSLFSIPKLRLGFWLGLEWVCPFFIIRNTTEGSGRDPD